MAGDRPRHIRHHSRLGSTASTNESNHGAPVPAEARNSTEDDATIAYIKRVLCQKPTKSGLAAANQPAAVNNIDSKPLEDVLPPLTSSNAIDVQLYAIIAVILNQFVQSWYNRITPDSDFVGEIVRIIAHCTRGLEDRLRQVDLEALLLDELPCLLDAHVHGMMEASLDVSDKQVSRC